MKKQVDDPPPAVRSFRRGVPTELETLVLDLLAKNPEERPTSAEYVFDKLLPFVRDLRMLAGVLAPPTEASPARMYASVAGRVLVGTDPVSPEPAPAPTIERPQFSRSDVDRARAEATALVQQSRYGQAAEILAAVAGPATQVLGSLDPSVVSLRFELANVRFDGGDYRGAASVYGGLARDLGDPDTDDDLALRCRRQEATCNALIGETSLALRQLEELLEAERRRYGDDDERVLELRRQIALLQLGTGRTEEAAASARTAVIDADRALGSTHPVTTALRELLSTIRR
jgi:hypothetical protein